MGPLEWVAVAFGIVSVYLSTRQNIWSWPTAIVNVVLYVFVFYGSRLYADMGLQVIYAVLNSYGWYHWLRGGNERAPLPVSRTPVALWGRLAGIAIAGSVTLAFLLSRYTDAALPVIDASLSVTSLVAQWMMARKLVENWLIWVAVDVVYIPMYIYKDLYPTAALYAVFLALSLMGFFQWRRDYRLRLANQTA